MLISEYQISEMMSITRGNYPRSFNFDPTGRFLYCCNQRADSIAVFHVERGTGDLRGMFGWRERVDAMAEVYHGLAPEERKRTIIFAAGYGNAGAVDHFGKGLGLPRASSLAMTYWIWGLPKEPFDTVIGIGFPPEVMEKIFNQVQVMAKVELKNVNPWETPFYVTVCRDPKVPLEKVWLKNRPW